MTSLKFLQGYLAADSAISSRFPERYEEPMANGVRVRRDVWKLPAWDPILVWYARGIEEMQKRPPQNPISWRYQAAIHGYSGNPPAASQAYWSQCQHNSWYFLPWHRAYLHCFESVVAATVASLGGPSDWALPYWNYNDAANPRARQLPPAFYAATLPDGSANPLRVDRDAGNGGEEVAEAEDIDLSFCLREVVFGGTAGGGTPGFGGGVTSFNHDKGGPIGILEMQPHGSIHVAVGGFMAGFATAGLDPIFWLHHANIDRLWEVWLERRPQNRNPVDQRWLTRAFPFHDAAGQAVTFTAAQVLDTSAAPLGYRYEDVTDPLVEAVAMVEEAPRRAAVGRTPEMIGATEAPISLLGQAVTAEMPVMPPTGPAREVLESPTERPRTYLNIENITGAGMAPSYAVYLNVPAGADPLDHADLRAGILPMFGMAEASRTDADHPGSGLHYALDVTDVMKSLQSRGDWDAKRLRVTFVPRRRAAATEVTEAPRQPVVVGRISLYLG